MSGEGARELAQEIEEHDCRVTGRRCWGEGRWELEVVDTMTGIRFLVIDRVDWEERLRASQLYD